MADDRQKQRLPHSLILENRKCLSLSGVKDVGSFDDEAVTIYTDFGELNVRGRSLHISKLNLDSGEVTIDGELAAMVYTENKQAGGFMSKLFR